MRIYLNLDAEIISIEIMISLWFFRTLQYFFDYYEYDEINEMRKALRYDAETNYGLNV